MSVLSIVGQLKKKKKKQERGKKRKRERQRQTDRQTDRQTETETVVCACVRAGSDEKEVKGSDVVRLGFHSSLGSVYLWGYYSFCISLTLGVSAV